MISFKRLLRVSHGAAWLLCAAGAVAVTLEEGPLVMRLAERGSAGAQVLLAGMYLRGEGGVARDDQRAAEWFEKAAVQGNDYGAMKLGDLYEAGQGVPQNARLAADWRERAANRGNVRAQRLLGRMYLIGDGVPRNDSKAAYWLNRAALEGDDAEAQYLLALMHRSGRVVPPNPALAGNLLARAAAQNYDDAVELLHRIQVLGFSIEESLHQRSPHLHRLAEDGDAEAQYQLGLRLENALFGGPTARREAVGWFERAAASGHVMAMRSLAHIYETGLDGVPADSQKAFYWRQKAGQRE